MDDASADAHVKPYWETLPPGATAEVPGLDGLTHRPLVMLVEEKPDSNVIDTDEPTFLLYEDGTVLYHRVTNDGAPGEAMRADIGATGAQAVADELVKLGVLDLPNVDGLGSDEPRVELFVRLGARWHEAIVYGASRANLSRDGRAPPAFFTAYRRLATYQAPGATTWSPDEIEIHVWGGAPGSRAPAWPDPLPRLPAPLKPQPETHVEVVPGTYEPTVRAFKRPDGGYNMRVNLDGFDWMFDYIRRVPEEAYVRKVRDARWRFAPRDAQ